MKPSITIGNAVPRAQVREGVVPAWRPEPWAIPAPAANAESSLHHVCAWCRRVRGPDGAWHAAPNPRKLLATRRVTHGICPHCASRMMAGA